MATTREQSTSERNIPQANYGPILDVPCTSCQPGSLKGPFMCQATAHPTLRSPPIATLTGPLPCRLILLTDMVTTTHSIMYTFLGVRTSQLACTLSLYPCLPTHYLDIFIHSPHSAVTSLVEVEDPCQLLGFPSMPISFSYATCLFMA
jgi:hypothetical protein